MHVRMANALRPQLKMAPDSPLATQNSRHPITEAGFDTIVENMEAAVGARRQAAIPPSGKIRYDGLETPETLSMPCHKIVRVTPTNETWIVYLDPETDLPVLVQATAENGDRLEHFVFRDLSFDPADLASADAFSPEARWGPSRGLFQRLARAGTANAETDRITLTCCLPKWREIGPMLVRGNERPIIFTNFVRADPDYDLASEWRF